MATECGWLIEKKDADGRPMWAAFSDGGVDWKYDANDACRFSRRSDAEQMAYGEDVECITEHAFDDGAITAERAVQLIKQLADRNTDSDYREAVKEIVASVR